VTDQSFSDPLLSVNSVPREQYDLTVLESSRQLSNMRDERDEARAERDALVIQRERLLEVATDWDVAYNDPFTIGTHPFSRELRHAYEVPDGQERVEGPAVLTKHNARVKASALYDAAASLDESHLTRAVADILRHRADTILEEAGA
jgi:hypothetical protein